MQQAYLVDTQAQTTGKLGAKSQFYSHSYESNLLTSLTRFLTSTRDSLSRRLVADICTESREHQSFSDYQGPTATDRTTQIEYFFSSVESIS